MSPRSDRLEWVTRGDMISPDRLNERPIYLRAIFLMLAVVQSARHIFQGFSFIKIPISPQPKPSDKDQRTHVCPTLVAQLQMTSIEVFKNSLLLSLAVALLGPFCYTIFLRRPLWALHLEFAKPFFNLPRSNARPVGYPPSNLVLIIKSFLASLLLLVTWEATSVLLKLYLAQEPTKKGLPLSAGSKDPNGTLLNGLKARKAVVKTFAFWELAIIAQSMPERRKAIFGDIDRPGGPRWSEMLESALNVLRDINKRVEASQPPPPAPDLRTAAGARIETLPKIVPEAQKKPILQSSPKPKTRTERAEQLVSAGIKRLGRSPEPWKPPVKELIEYGKSSSGIGDVSEKLSQQWTTYFQSSFWMWLFKTTPDRKVNTLVLGHPVGNAAIVVDAIESVTKMLIASLAEDVYGKAVSGVPETVRTFTKTINTIEQLVRESKHSVDGSITEVLIILGRLKAGLAELLAAFQLYLADVGLGISELNAAKKAAGVAITEETHSDLISLRPIDPGRGAGRERDPISKDIFELYRNRPSEKEIGMSANEKNPRRDIEPDRGAGEKKDPSSRNLVETSHKLASRSEPKENQLPPIGPGFKYRSNREVEGLRQPQQRREMEMVR